jgi:hypothetical protein
MPPPVECQRFATQSFSFRIRSFLSLSERKIKKSRLTKKTAGKLAASSKTISKKNIPPPFVASFVYRVAIATRNKLKRTACLVNTYRKLSFKALNRKHLASHTRARIMRNAQRMQRNVRGWAWGLLPRFGRSPRAPG